MYCKISLFRDNLIKYCRQLISMLFTKPYNYLYTQTYYLAIAKNYRKQKEKPKNEKKRNEQTTNIMRIYLSTNKILNSE